MADWTWPEAFKSVDKIAEFHRVGDCVETPKLSPDIVNATKLLIMRLARLGHKEPTVFLGTCDATIVFEFHDYFGPKTFKSIEAVDNYQAEVYLYRGREDDSLFFADIQSGDFGD